MKLSPLESSPVKQVWDEGSLSERRMLAPRGALLINQELYRTVQAAVEHFHFANVSCYSPASLTFSWLFFVLDLVQTVTFPLKLQQEMNAKWIWGEH